MKIKHWFWAACVSAAVASAGAVVELAQSISDDDPVDAARQRRLQDPAFGGVGASTGTSTSTTTSTGTPRGVVNPAGMPGIATSTSPVPNQGIGFSTGTGNFTPAAPTPTGDPATNGSEGGGPFR